jgi:hypothetical protein
VLWKLHISASSNHAARIGFDPAHWVEFDWKILMFCHSNHAFIGLVSFNCSAITVAKSEPLSNPIAFEIVTNSNHGYQLVSFSWKILMFYHSNHAFTGSDNQSIEKTKLKSRLPIQITPRGSVLTPLIGSNSIERYWCFATQMKLLQIQITATNWYRLAERYWCFATQITPLPARIINLRNIYIRLILMSA